jgi:signal transduction histidine kinase
MLTRREQAQQLQSLAGQLARAEGVQAALRDAAATLATLIPGSLAVAAACWPRLDGGFASRKAAPEWLVAAAGRGAADAAALEQRIAAGLARAAAAPTLAAALAPAGRTVQPGHEVRVTLDEQTFALVGVARTGARRSATIPELVGAVAGQVRLALLAVRRAEDLHLAQQYQREHHEFVAAVCHDLRTPLTSIRGYAQLLHRQARSDTHAALRPALELIIQQVDRLSSLAEILLDVIRIETRRLALHRGAVDLAQAVVEVLASFDPRLSPPPRFDAPDEPVIVHADRRRLVQMIRAMVSFSTERAQSAQELAPLALRIARTGQEATLEVEDCGSTLDPDECDRLFTRLVTIGEEGEARSLARVDLVIARGLAEAHGGGMEVMSPPEGLEAGARLILRLPLSQEYLGSRPTAPR